MRQPFRSALVASLAAMFLLGGCQREASATPASTPSPTPTSTAAPTPQPPAPPLGQEPPSLAPLVERVKSAVVNVDVQSRVENAMVGTGFPFFGIPGMPGGQQSPQVRQGAGSGFIIDSQGLVLTNNHVVEKAVSIRVKLDDGRSFDAKVLGRDPLTDLALLKLEGTTEPLPSVKLGDSEAMRVGDYVVAIGNPFGLASSVSAGIISARARDIHAGPYDDFLQTDAAINPGNSGGPLFNLRGEVIGINTAIIGGGTGIGFAVPANMAKRLLPQLEQGEVRRGWLGIGIQDLTPELAEGLKVPAKGGAIVANVTAGTPADKAGLQQDDVVTAIDGEAIESSRELTQIIGFRAPGTKVTLTAWRGGEKREFQVELGERPDLEGVSTGSVEPPATERLGLSLRDVDPRLFDRSGGPESGALIANVTPGSAADRAGLRPGMVVIEAAGSPVQSARDLARKLADARSGDSVLLRIQAGGGQALRAIRIP